ncbi:hypothetical protein EV189_1905 [Motilibacter rhizosphaerae]|uniref:Uncharacterized protein n=1 Tax=Motilibacter rhizosphaerae TaxID=598652 RepID=A0A4Q7NUM2_9ACTN|nr:hypothetical protein [Motilibacter rhizosphaerae]RZS90122.1 hypothetical protein EV189_1905 [Motilibacter rhizosphaerae]
MLLAHGIVGRQDLPLPFGYVLAGAALALLVSFAALGALWSTPRLAGAEGRALPDALQRVLRAPATARAVRVAGLVVCGWFLASGLLGRDVDTNPFPGAVFVLLWVGIVPASVLLGPVWRAVSPLRTLHAAYARLAGTRPEEGLLRLPARVGQWPAALALLAFVWLELVAPDRTTLPVLRAWFGTYAGVLLVGSAVYGSAWFAAADPFEAWSGAFGRLSPLGRRADGTWVLRSPLSGMTTLPVQPGALAVVLVMLGSTAWDSWSGSLRWVTYAQTVAHRTLLGTAGLVACVLLIGAAYLLAVWLAGRFGGRAARGLPGSFAHTLVPIALGYVVAHYYSLLVYQGQRTVILATDPLQRGADLLGLRSASISSTLIAARIVAGVQVTAVVTGHVLGVVLAHDRSLALFPRRAAVLGQLPLLVLMVGYTVGGLFLLFSG